MNLEFHRDKCSRKGKTRIEVMEFDSKEDWEIERCLECGVKVRIRRLPKQNNGLSGVKEKVEGGG